MTKNITIIFIIVFILNNSLLAQDSINGTGYILSGLQRQSNGEWLNFYRLANPKQQNEKDFFDSIYAKALAQNNFRFVVGKSNLSIISQIDTKNSYNLLACKGLSNADSFIVNNHVFFDIGNCARMRISRPFTANIKQELADSLGYILNIDKVKFDGYILGLDSLDLYTKLMSYRIDDREKKLVCFIHEKRVMAKLSVKSIAYRPVIVFVPRQLIIFDKDYHNLEPNCFEKSDN